LTALAQTDVRATALSAGFATTLEVGSMVVDAYFYNSLPRARNWWTLAPSLTLVVPSHMVRTWWSTSIELFVVGPCASAARGGHLAVLQWARADGCQWQWGLETCAKAAEGEAEGGHLAALQWVRGRLGTGAGTSPSGSAFTFIRSSPRAINKACMSHITHDTTWTPIIVNENRPDRRTARAAACRHVGDAGDRGVRS
jgi:hypothetical protein